MSQVVIRAENLSKKYRIRSGRERSIMLREALTEAILRPFRKLSALGGHNGSQGSSLEPGRSSGLIASVPSTIWALKDVSFDVKEGEVVGIIGPNGAGKSTLLKLLSRITEPTTGRVELRGRVASLLEVGTGFHSELTGRENIYLNGSLLGMKRAEIKRRFDEIVDFAEVEQFIDTPVKRYSSGMYVRLAFAVAAHLDPEILIVDEVLAVGDASYQLKCVRRMFSMAEEGKTILFVSHNLDIIPRLCSRGVLLGHGQIKEDGPTRDVVDRYLASQLEDESGENLANKPRHGDGRARFTRLELLDCQGRLQISHIAGEDLILHMEVTAEYNVPDAELAVVLKTLSGARLITSWTHEVNFPVTLRKGKQWYECRFRRVSLRPGLSISLELWMDANGVIDSVENARIVQVVDGEGTDGLSTDSEQGVVLCEYKWREVRRVLVEDRQ
jgi:lipopolysaccharide transport system ATP-binding protein